MLTDRFLVRQLADVVCSSPDGWIAAEKCCAALRQTDGDLQGGRVSKAHLERIYRIRLARPEAAADGVGADRLLADFAAYEGDHLILVDLVGAEGQIFAMFFDEAVSRLIACFVGRDHLWRSDIEL